MRFLVIEDEPPVAELLQRALEQLGNTCFLARDAREAEALIVGQPVDALTLDLSMPGPGGLEWLESVAQCRPELARRTLVITGTILGADKVERLARCGAGILAKPFTLGGLEDAIRSQIAHNGGRDGV